MYYAHSTDVKDRSNWHLLRDHLEATARLAKQYGDHFGAGPAAGLAGLLHDLGKYTPEFQALLEGAKRRVDHSTAGAAMALELAKGDSRVIAELVAYAIAGHHAGLPDKQGESFSTLSSRLKDFAGTSLGPAWKDEIEPDANGLAPKLAFASSDIARLSFQLSVLGRMIFSCLVDADFKDTEAFYARMEGRQVDRDWPALQAILHDLCVAFDRHMDGLRRADSPINSLRTTILHHVLSRAGEQPGLFTLTVPTGGGKTLASLGFALHHARLHGLRRVIYAIPFTTIIDQTATILRRVMGDDVVLEHHSAIDEDVTSHRREGKDKLKLAMEDWAAPIVVTTNVQIFESLFAARPSRCRKLHNIAGSVLILDEAQTLPRPLLAPTMAMLRELAQNYGCTIVICTATQPALDERNFAATHVPGLPLEGRELAPDPHALACKLRRVRIRHAGAMDDVALIEELASQEQGLVIVNTRHHALALYRAALETGLDGLVHLTTRQCAVHRREILEEVRRRLREGKPCRLIATSLVEAGVDLDFPRVWRAEAGLDQIAQAAGRCNREGRRPVETSIVTIFTAPDHPPPLEIKGLSGDMGRILQKHNDLLSPAAMEDFFGEVYWRVGPEGLDAKSIRDDFRIGSGETNFAYRTVGEKFRMIESGMLPVIIPRDALASDAIARLAVEQIPTGALARVLQPYVVQVPPKARELLINCGHVKFVEPHLRGDQFAVLQSDDLYDSAVGLIWEDSDYLRLENVII